MDSNLKTGWTAKSTNTRESPAKIRLQQQTIKGTDQNVANLKQHGVLVLMAMYTVIKREQEKSVTKDYNTINSRIS